MGLGPVGDLVRIEDQVFEADYGLSNVIACLGFTERGHDGLRKVNSAVGMCCGVVCGETRNQVTGKNARWLGPGQPQHDLTKP
ncbi:hypothetical protein D3C77_346610 [compost metagenome]